MSLCYYNPFEIDNGGVISCDNVRINFFIESYYAKDFLNFVGNLTSSHIEDFPEKRQSNKFRYMWNFYYQNDNSIDLETMNVGFFFNGLTKNDSNGRNYELKGYLDFNPNKVALNSQFWTDFYTIKSFCECWEIARVDIAIDIRTKREFMILEKDQRKYSLDAYSRSNRTEYLGRRSNIGFVKLYNKTLESELDYDLTRIEVTCEPNYDSFVQYFPKVYDFSISQQLDLEFAKLNDTDRTIVLMTNELIRSGNDNGMMYFNSLSLYKKRKLRNYLLSESALVSVVKFSNSLVLLLSNIHSLYD